MLSQKELEELARGYARRTVMDAQCGNRSEVIEFLTISITHMALLIEQRSDPDTAQCALYVPYEQLNKMENKKCAT
ncbi:MAG: hypothetical protein RPT25_06570 [Cycloclasticus sp.]